VFPTRQSLGLMKAKLKGAETGHSLLKRKSEALTKYVPMHRIDCQRGRADNNPHCAGASEISPAGSMKPSGRWVA